VPIGLSRNKKNIMANVRVATQNYNTNTMDSSDVGWWCQTDESAKTLEFKMMSKFDSVISG
jgi:hypothetical protein